MREGLSQKSCLANRLARQIMDKTNLNISVRDGGEIIDLDPQQRICLLADADCQAYLLYKPIGRILAAEFYKLLLCKQVIINSNFIITKDEGNGVVELAVAVGVYPESVAHKIEDQLCLLEEATDRGLDLAKNLLIDQGRPPHLKDTHILTCNGPIYPETKNIQILQAQLLRLRSTTPRFYGDSFTSIPAVDQCNPTISNPPFMFVISGARGVGKKTALGLIFRNMGITGYLLDDESRHPDHLIEQVKGIAKQLRGVDSCSLVFSDIIGDVILKNDSLSSQLLLSAMMEISSNLPIILLTTTPARPSCLTGYYRFEEETADVLSRMLQVHFPGQPCPPLDLPVDSSLANPLQSIIMYGFGETMAEGLTNSRLLPPFDECLTFFREHVSGQEHALHKLLSFIKGYDHFQPANRDMSRKTINILACGPSGCGKTLTAKTLAKLMKVNFLLIPCNEAVSDEFFISRLTGSAAGYVGYADSCTVDLVKPGSFAAKIWGTVIIFDEIEKCSTKVRQMLLTLMEEGEIRTAKRVIRLENNVVFFTSNHGADILNRKRIGFSSGSIKPTVGLESFFINDDEFSNEFLSRLSLTVEYETLAHQTQQEVVAMTLRSLLESHQLIRISEEEVTRIARHISEVHAAKLAKLGARAIESIIRETVLSQMTLLLDRGISGDVTVILDGGFKVSLTICADRQ